MTQQELSTPHKTRRRISSEGITLRAFAVPVLLVPFAIAVGPLAEPAPNRALPAEATFDQCESLPGAVSSAWSREIKPDIDAFFAGIDQTVSSAGSLRRKTGGVVQRGMAAANAPTLADALELMGQSVETMVLSLTSGWGELGPQSLDLPGNETGTITPVVGTTRMFITPPNLTHDRVRFTVTKTDGRQRADVTICKARYEEPGQYTRVRVLEWDNGLANSGESQSVTINNALGYYFTVKVRKNVGTNSFSYRVNASTLGQATVE